MDNITHGLWGIGIYGAWAATHPQLLHSPLSTTVFVAAVLGSEAPDADYVVKLVKGPAAYLRQHRAVSHSLPFWFLWAFIIAGGLSLWHPGHFGLLYGLALLGVVVHVLLDILTPYGTQALWPMTNKRFKLDILFTIDPVFILLGVAGLILTHRGDTRILVVAWCFMIALVYIGVRGIYATWLTTRLGRMAPDANRVSIIPQIVPWWWAYVIETSDGVIGGPMHFKGPMKEEIRWVRPASASSSGELANWAMQQTDLGQLFVWFARHLIWQVQRDGALEKVYLADATYRFRQWLPFAVCISVLKGESGGWVVGSEIIRGQSVDFTAIGEDLVDGSEARNTTGQSGVPGTGTSSNATGRLKPKVPTERG